jgi:hypothetical protein
LDEKERALFEKEGGHRDKCPAAVGNAAAWTCELILREIDLDRFRFLRCAVEGLH